MLLGVSVPCVPVAAQPAENTLLTLDRIFSSDEFQEERQAPRVFSHRSESYWTTQAVKAEAIEKTPKKPAGTDLTRIDLATGEIREVIPASALTPAGADTPLAIEGFAFSEDESRLLIFTATQRVWRRNTRGDYWVLDRKSQVLKKLGGDAPASSLQFAKFSPDATRVAYVRQNNLFVEDVESGVLRPLTLDGSDRIVNGTGDWVNEEELDIRDGFRWSPDGHRIAYWQFDTTGVPDFTLIDNTSRLHAQTRTFAYPKVGCVNSAVRIGVVDVSTSVTRWLDLEGDPRNHYVARVEWLPESPRILLHQFNRLQNTLRVFLADPGTGRCELAHTEQDDAWLENDNPVVWLEKGRRLLWLSERGGCRQAYSLGLDGSMSPTITPGEYDILRVEAVDPKSASVYLSASPDNPTQSYLYRVPLSGGQPVRLTPQDQPGWHSYSLSPDAGWAIHTYSSLARPPIVELVRLPEHTVVRVLAENRRLHETWAKIKQPQAEFLRLDAGGAMLDAWCLHPERAAPGPHPLLIYIYGEPHGQTVRDSWQGSRGLWHALLAQQGVMVASIDNRGTMVPRGRAWRKCVYRQVGILASADQAAALKSLQQRFESIDRQRVAVWGWSGGGSMSLNLIFRHPDLYQTAISIAPVPDQTLYDTIYQERYMGLPDDNAEGYRAGSPLTHAGQLQGNLLLIHGTGDDNCHYQGTERLMNELIAHNKIFTALPYPNRSHSVSEGKNTTRHLYSLMLHYLQHHLLQSQAPQLPSTRK